MVITGLIGLGASAYAAWVAPDLARRISGNVKAHIERASSRGEALRLRSDGATLGRTRPAAIPMETRGKLREDTMPMRGGLMPASSQELAALEPEQAATASLLTDAGDGDNGAGAELARTPAGSSAVGSPGTDMGPSKGPEPPTMDSGERGVPKRVCPPGVQHCSPVSHATKAGGRAKPPGKTPEKTARLAGADLGDATSRAMRLMEKARREPGPIEAPPKPAPRMPRSPLPGQNRVLNRHGAPILE
jgi:hypothetical protein